MSTSLRQSDLLSCVIDEVEESSSDSTSSRFDDGLVVSELAVGILFPVLFPPGGPELVTTSSIFTSIVIAHGASKAIVGFQSCLIIFSSMEFLNRNSVVQYARSYLPIIWEPGAQCPSNRRSSSDQPNWFAQVGNQARALRSVHLGFLYPKCSHNNRNIFKTA